MNKKLIAGIAMWILFWGITNVSQATIINPSFESDDGWIATSSATFGVDKIPASYLVQPADGTQIGRIYSGSGSVINQGQYGQWAQIVDLTNVATILFDATIQTWLQSPSGQSFFLHSFLETQVLVDNTILWSKQNVGGTFPSQAIDTSSFTGSSELTFRLYAIDDSNGENSPRISSSWFMFDNVREIAGDPVPEPTTMLLLGTGLVGVAGAARRRKKKQA